MCTIRRELSRRAARIARPTGSAAAESSRTGSDVSDVGAEIGVGVMLVLRVATIRLAKSFRTRTVADVMLRIFSRMRVHAICGDIAIRVADTISLRCEFLRFHVIQVSERAFERVHAAAAHLRDVRPSTLARVVRTSACSAAPGKGCGRVCGVMIGCWVHVTLLLATEREVPLQRVLVVVRHARDDVVVPVETARVDGLLEATEVLDVGTFDGIGGSTSALLHRNRTGLGTRLARFLDRLYVPFFKLLFKVFALYGRYCGIERSKSPQRDYLVAEARRSVLRGARRVLAAASTSTRSATRGSVRHRDLGVKPPGGNLQANTIMQVRH